VLSAVVSHFLGYFVEHMARHAAGYNRNHFLSFVYIGKNRSRELLLARPGLALFEPIIKKVSDFFFWPHSRCVCRPYTVGVKGKCVPEILLGGPGYTKTAAKRLAV
jgi:hypothetical protein